MTSASTRANSADLSHAARPSRVVPILLLLAALLVAVMAVRLYVGAWGVGWPVGEAAADIRSARIFRLLLGVTVGSALSVAGVALQALLRNPLAEPYILGLSTGAAAGIMAQSLLFYSLGISLGTFFGATHAGAVAGAGLSMLVVFLASRRRGLIDPLGLLLTGVVLSTISGALVMMMSYWVGPGIVREDMARWMMGYLNENLSVHTACFIAGITLAGFAALLVSARSMDIATLSEGEARSLGVNLARLRTLLFVVASVLAAGAVVLAGPIAFVGLVCPHVARLLLGPSHGPLLVGSALAGAMLILLADLASEGLALYAGVGRMPIGIFTALVGGPAFLWMLRPQLGRSTD